MSLIITFGREFGSGGRELGRRLADELGIAYYDKEILLEISKKTPYCLEYIESVSEKKPMPLLPIHYGMSFSLASDPNLDQSIDIYAAQAKTLKELAAKSSCVIIGRAGDEVLKDLHPIRVFVYAEMEAKIARCREREHGAENLTDKQIEKKIRQIDKDRARYYEFYTGKKWGDKENYDLCINTTHLDIKRAAHALADLLRPVLEEEKAK